MELAESACGPIVVFNASEHRSDVIIVTSKEVKALPPELGVPNSEGKIGSSLERATKGPKENAVN
jgi:hypothetical protein